MPSQRYERVAANDEDDTPIHVTTTQPYPIPSSPPPSFRSHDSTPTSPTATHRLLSTDPLDHDATRTLNDAFDSPSDDEDDTADGGRDVRQRLMRADPQAEVEAESRNEPRMGVQRTVTQLPVFSATPATGRVYGGGMGTNDGVFANMSAKPQRGDDHDEKPPTYEQAAADATPPYWETTILAPGMLTDEVYIDGLPVGSFPSLFWNFIITFGFPVVGFLLTYLLHTTHAAKRGSFAGLGALMIQYGFTMKGAADNNVPLPGTGGDGQGPTDPNSHDFNPDDTQSGGGVQGVTGEDWLAYGFMIVGWFILIKSLSDFLKARKHEQLVLTSPERTAAREEADAENAV